VVEQVHETVRTTRAGEVLLQAAGEVLDELGVRVDGRSGCRLAEQQVVGEHDPVPGGNRPDLVTAVAVEGDERQSLLRSLIRRGLAAVANLKRAAPEGRGQTDHERGDHPVVLL
jgi:hypothetical protein